MLKYSTGFCGIGLSRDLTKDDRTAEKANYMQTRQYSRLTGANAVPVARATRVGNKAQANVQVAQTTDQSPPNGEGEPEGT